MSEVVIKNSIPLSLLNFREIFFESSSKKYFANEQEREDFFHKYLGFYLDKDPELTFYAQKDNLTIGYCVGLEKTFCKELLNVQPHLELFQDLYVKFPSHLHMNCDFRYRGQGIGSKLLLAFERKITGRNISGLHIMTSSNSPNVSFYRKAGFSFEIEREWNGNRILFMGKEF